MSNGTVKFFNNSKGFGFITPEEGDKDVFVHASGLVDEIRKEGDKVSYDVEESPKGLNAINVKVNSSITFNSLKLEASHHLRGFFLTPKLKVKCIQTKKA